jgi:GABA(A) receptor-associated protein
MISKKEPKFSETFSVEQRTKESEKILAKYPNRIPVIVERSNTCSDEIPIIDKKKFLVPTDLTVGQFIYIVRKRIKIPSTKAIFLFTEKHTLPPTSSTMNTIYDNSKNADNFLYFTYHSETTFGNL